jgi:hypothetical protein
VSPECIFIHTGLNDVLDQRTTDNIRKSFEDLIWYLLENTSAKLCFSMIIPTRNSSSLNQKINEANNIIKDLVSEARAYNSTHRMCLFSYSNDSLDHQSTFNQASHQVSLTDIGKLIMWTRLSYGLRKTLRLPRKQLRDRSRNQNTDSRRLGQSQRPNNQNTEDNG